MNFILIIALIIYLFIVSKTYFENQLKRQKLLVILLFIVHFAAMILAYKNTIEFPIYDAYNFYKFALEAPSWFSLFGLGSSFLSFLIYPLVKAGVSLFVLFMLFATISYRTFLMFFDEMSKVNMQGSINLALLAQVLFLLPSLHYWSCLVGKDCLIFFLLTYLVFEFQKQTKIKLLHIVASILLIFLRPHVFIAVFVAFSIYCLFSRTISREMKIKFSAFSLIALAFLGFVLLRFMKIEPLSYENVIKTIESLNYYAENSGSGIRLDEFSYLERIWLLLFRPFFYDAKTNYQLFISIENAFVLLSTIFLIIYILSNKKTIKLVKELKFAFLTGSCILLMIALYIYNLGLASRMRLMFFPLFFYVLHQLVVSKEVEKV